MPGIDINSGFKTLILGWSSPSVVFLHPKIGATLVSDLVSGTYGSSTGISPGISELNTRPISAPVLEN